MVTFLLVSGATHGHPHGMLEIGAAHFVALAGMFCYAYPGGLVEKICRLLFIHRRTVVVWRVGDCFVSLSVGGCLTVTNVDKNLEIFTLAE